MKDIKLLFVGIIIGLSFISCGIRNLDSGRDLSEKETTIVGTIEKLEVTVWQYGTHMISGYAITSETIKLDKYIGKEVSLIGREIEGYPVDDGPRYFEVKSIEEVEEK